MKKCRENEHQYKKIGVIFASENSIEKQLIKCSLCEKLAFGVRSSSGSELVIVKKFKKIRPRPPRANYGGQGREK